MSMVVARMTVRVEMRHIIVLMKMAMDKIMRLQESEIFQDILCVSVPDLPLIFPHHH